MSSGPEGSHSSLLANELVGPDGRRQGGPRGPQTPGGAPSVPVTSQDPLRGVPVDRATANTAHLTSIGVATLRFVTHPASPASLRIDVP